MTAQRRTNTRLASAGKVAVVAGLAAMVGAPPMAEARELALGYFMSPKHPMNEAVLHALRGEAG